MNLPDGTGGPHAFVDDLSAPQLDDDDAHHLNRALRLRAGDSLTVSDGLGRWRSCRFGSQLEIASDIVEVDAAQPTLTVAFALTKGAKPETVVQKLTELGIDTIVPFTAERSIARWDPERGQKHVERLRRVAREAGMQSRRVRLPTVASLATFSEVAGLAHAVRADRQGAPMAAVDITVLIGPEGGWSQLERELLPSVTLAEHVLRAETAAIAAGTLMTAHRAEHFP